MGTCKSNKLRVLQFGTISSSDYLVSEFCVILHLSDKDVGDNSTLAGVLQLE
jgi:hypothetical protein